MSHVLSRVEKVPKSDTLATAFFPLQRQMHKIKQVNCLIEKIDGDSLCSMCTYSVLTLPEAQGYLVITQLDNKYRWLAPLDYF